MVFPFFHLLGKTGVYNAYYGTYTDTNHNKTQTLGICKHYTRKHLCKGITKVKNQIISLTFVFFCFVNC